MERMIIFAGTERNPSTMGRTKIQLEFSLKAASRTVLWTSISTPSGLSTWFANNVDYHGQKMTFTWGKDDTRTATIKAIKAFSYIRLTWDDSPDKDEYLELRMSMSEITRDHTLLITDFADDDEAEDLEDLWEMQIDTLRRVNGF